MQMRISHDLVPAIDALPADERRQFWIAVAELLMGIVELPQPKKKAVLHCLPVGGKSLYLQVWPERGPLDVAHYGEAKPPANYALRDYDELTGQMVKSRLRSFGVWKTPIDDDQLKIAGMDAEGPVSVIGNAGTGKSTVAVHRVRWLLQNGFPKGGRILLTSYGNTLVLELRRLLFGLYLEDKITWDEYCRVDVKTLDRIAIDVCDNLDRQIVYEKKEYDLLIEWINAAHKQVNDPVGWNIPSGQFLLSFFEDAVLDYRLDSRWDYEKYLLADRDGMKERERRQKVWPLFESMLEMERTSPKVVRSYGFRLAEEFYEREPSPYCSIVVDEAQDVGRPELRMLARMTDNSLAYPKRNSLFFVGDGFQRIYGREALLRECGINVGERGGGRYRHMKKNYRSTKQIREFALPFVQNVVARNLDGEAQSARDGVSVMEGDSPQIEFFGDYSDMNERIAEVIAEWQSADGEWPLGNYAVLMRETSAYGKPQMALYGQVDGLLDFDLSAEPVDWNILPKDADAVKVMSMHRAKGLQFAGVVVVIDHWPYQVSNPTDYTKEELKRKWDSELCLIYTAMMRAQRHLFITGTDPNAQKVFAECRKTMPAKKDFWTVMWQPKLFSSPPGKTKLIRQQS